jgi:Family of unknown function (DUF6267)
MGGNVFKSEDGRALTGRINQTDVKPTLAWLEQMLPIDLQNNTLGSTGLKPTSGDIDVAVNLNEVSKDQVFQELVAWASAHGLKPTEWVKKSGNSVHFRTPIAGNPDKGYVQTDFMFMNDMPFTKWFLSAPMNSDYKGAYRNIFLNSLGKPLGLKVNQNIGLVDRATNELVPDGNNPDTVAKMLLNKNATRDDLYSVESILQALESDPKREEKLHDFRGFMEKEGVPFLESRGESDVHFLARLRDRIVNQGMRPLVESEEPVVSGGRAKGIEHIEDLVFRRGTAGIRDAVHTIEHLAHSTEESTTVKWDGSPALIFGREPDGSFVLTDVSGFGATGYDGMFKSVKQVANVLAKRDEDAREKGRSANRIESLLPIYQKVWPLLEAATPKQFRGFIQGDLLYTSTPPEQSGAYVFTPNTITYRIPANSELGRRIGDSDVGVAVHTMYSERGGQKQPIGHLNFKPVPGLYLIEPVRPTQNVKPSDKSKFQQLKTLTRQYGSAIDTLFNPAELRALQITDLPKLCVDYVNYLVKNPNIENFNADQMLGGFAGWLKDKTTARKLANIVEYLQSPKSNTDAMAAAFTIFVLIHDLKTDLLQQLDRQIPGNEGWVVATPKSTTKFVNRFDFSRNNLTKAH